MAASARSGGAASCAAPAWPASASAHPALLSACGTPAAKQTADSCVEQGPVRRARRRCTSPTGRSTSTRRRSSRAARRSPSTRRSRSSRSETGIKVDYVTDVNDNAEFFGDGAQPARRLQADRPRHHDADRLDGRPDGQPRLAAEARQGQACPTSTPTWCRPSSRPSWDKNRDYSRAVAERPDRHRLQRQADQGGPQLRRAARPARTSRARSACSRRCTTRCCSCCCSRAPTPRTSPTTSSARRIDRLKKATDAGQIRRVHRQRVRPGPASRATSSPARPGPATSSSCSSTTRTSSSSRRRRASSLWSDNMLVPEQGRRTRRNAEELMNYYYDPEVAADAGRLGQLHLPGRGRQAGDGEDRPEPASTTS